MVEAVGEGKACEGPIDISSADGCIITVQGVDRGMNDIRLAGAYTAREEEKQHSRRAWRTRVARSPSLESPGISYELETAVIVLGDPERLKIFRAE